MDDTRYVYEIQQPLPSATTEQLTLGTGWHTVARACTPEGAGAVVSALCANPDPATLTLRVMMRVQL